MIECTKANSRYVKTLDCRLLFSTIRSAVVKSPKKTMCRYYDALLRVINTVPSTLRVERLRDAEVPFVGCG
jgi:hypothetical protein